MLDEKMRSRIAERIKRHLSDGIIVKEREGKYVQFFLDNAGNSLESAKLLYEASTNEKIKKELGLTDFNGFLWVINSSYYSMFYIARALLEKGGIKIRTELSIHSVTFDAIFYYYYMTGKLEKRIIEEFAEAEEEASQILGKEKAKELIEDYFHEKEKRGKYTYELGIIAMEAKAKTSLDRAKRFNEEIRKIIGI